MYKEDLQKIWAERPQDMAISKILSPGKSLQDLYEINAQTLGEMRKILKGARTRLEEMHEFFVLKDIDVSGWDAWISEMGNAIDQYEREKMPYNKRTQVHAIIVMIKDKQIKIEEREWHQVSYEKLRGEEEMGEWRGIQTKISFSQGALLHNYQPISLDSDHKWFFTTEYGLKWVQREILRLAIEMANMKGYSIVLEKEKVEVEL